MVVGIKERMDIKYRTKATLIFDNMRLTNRTVYGDKTRPSVKDIFVPYRLQRSGSSPSSVTVLWMGKRRRARLSFRTGKSGARIPVYTWNV